MDSNYSRIIKNRVYWAPLLIAAVFMTFAIYFRHMTHQTQIQIRILSKIVLVFGLLVGLAKRSNIKNISKLSKIYRNEQSLSKMKQATLALRAEAASIQPIIEAHRREVEKLTAMNENIQVCHNALSAHRTQERQEEFNMLQQEFKAQKEICDELQRKMQPVLQHIKASTENITAMRQGIVQDASMAAAPSPRER